MFDMRPHQSSEATTGSGRDGAPATSSRDARPEDAGALLPLDAVGGRRGTGGGEGAGHAAAKGAPVAARELPVARVLVDTSLAHLDRPFDYLVPEAMAAEAVPGCRVRVRFAGKLTDGLVLERAASTEHEGRLTPLERVVSPEPVLTPRIAALCRAVADRYAGTMSDVLRLAIPPRHAKVESEPQNPPPGAPAPTTLPPSSPASPQPSSPLAAVRLPSGATRPSSVPEGSRPSSGLGSVRPVDGGAPPPERGAEGRQESQGERITGGGDDPLPGVWGEYVAGPGFVQALAEGRGVRAVWTALPGVGEDGGPTWPEGVALAVLATVRAGKGALVVVPDGKDVALVDAALTRVLGEGAHVALTAGLGPAERYRRWLKVLRGQVRVVAGARAATFAPVHDLGLVVIWDDGDDLHAERLAPYPHTREVLALRAHQTGAAMLVGGHARTAEATRLVATGWAHPIGPARETVRRHAPRVRPAGDDAELARDAAARAARLPTLAWSVLRTGLESGPVLIQVPRRGYLPALACQACRTPARCVQTPPLAGLPPEAPAPRGTPDPSIPQPGRRRAPAAAAPAPRPSLEGSAWGLAGVPVARELFGDMADPQDAAAAAVMRFMPVPLCGGPLALRGGHSAPYCRWCGRIAGLWRCQICGNNRLRALVVGARRTAEELGRAFPSVPVRTSGRDSVLATVGSSRALVVATPGAEPVPKGGYAAAVLLDGWAMLGRPDLRAAEETLRRWMNAAALLRPGAELVVLADASLPVVQALVRWDPVTHAERELAERAALGFPPAVRMATLTGPPAAVRDMAAGLGLPEGAQVLGPVPVEAPRGRPAEPEERLMVRVPRGAEAALARALKGAAGVRAARKAPDLVRVCMDPMDLV
ncbi:hypothetical protein Skr01_71010 [Sphaerisporangium krabiense]|nr:hypothetical protein Skr01_71010 [Sphaerisporangium krabiense]